MGNIITFRSGRRVLNLPSEFALSEGVYSAGTVADFVRTRFQQLRADLPGRYSHRIFSAAAGFSSPNYLQLVSKGQRTLTPKSLPKFLRGLLLGKKDADRLVDMFVSEQADKARASLQVEKVQVIG